MNAYQALDNADLTVEQFKDRIFELILYNFREHTLIMLSISIIIILLPLFLISWHKGKKALEQRLNKMEKQWEKEEKIQS